MLVYDLISGFLASWLDVGVGVVGGVGRGLGTFANNRVSDTDRKRSIIVRFVVLVRRFSMVKGA